MDTDGQDARMCGQVHLNEGNKSNRKHAVNARSDSEIFPSC